MGNDNPKFMQILNYYIFQKRIKNNLNNNNTKDYSKIETGYFIHPEWIKEWRNMMAYDTINNVFDILKITTNKINEEQKTLINYYIKEKNIYIEINTQFLVKKNNFISMTQSIINEKLLENLVNYDTYYFLNLNKETKYEKIEYIFKKQMIIFIFKNNRIIKMLIHSLAPYNIINNLICLTFVYNYETKFNDFISLLSENCSNNIINYLLNMNIFEIRNYVGRDQFNDIIFKLSYEEVINDSFNNTNNNNQKNLSSSQKQIFKSQIINDDYDKNIFNDMNYNNNMGRMSYNFNNNDDFNMNNNMLSNSFNFGNNINNNEFKINNFNNKKNQNNNNNCFNNFNNDFTMMNNYNNFNNNQNNSNLNNINNYNNNFQNNFNFQNNNFNNNNNLDMNEDLENKMTQLLNEGKKFMNELTIRNENLKNEIKEREDQEFILNQKIIDLKNENILLKSKINVTNLNTILPDEKIIAIQFISQDQNINRSMACKDTNIFVDIEEKLYEDYPILKKTDNYFILKETKIKRFFSLKENNINDGDIIMINIIGNENYIM